MGRFVLAAVATMVSFAFLFGGCGKFDSANVEANGPGSVPDGPNDADPDAAVDGALDAAAAADASDAALPDAAEGWSWEGDSAELWTIANVDGARPYDCCGCVTTPACVACANDNTSLTQQVAGSMTFSSGPAVDSGMNHRTDGFAAIRRDVPVVPGLRRTAHIKVVKLSASATGDFNPASGLNQTPTWSFSIREGGKELGKYEATFATERCTACSGPLSALGDRQAEFTPVGNRVDLVLTATHHSSQCASEIFDVRVDVDYVRVQAN